MVIDIATSCDFGLAMHLFYPLRLPRILDGELTSTAEFLTMISGLSIWLRGCHYASSADLRPEIHEPYRMQQRIVATASAFCNRIPAYSVTGTQSKFKGGRFRGMAEPVLRLQRYPIVNYHC
jgi:hypothetical protein